LGVAIQGARQQGLLAPASARAARQVQRAANGARHQAWAGEGFGFPGKFGGTGLVTGEGKQNGIHVHVGVEQDGEDSKVPSDVSSCEENGSFHGNVSGECKGESPNGKFSGDSGLEVKFKQGKLADFGKVFGEGKGKSLHCRFVGFGKVDGDGKEKKKVPPQANLLTPLSKRS